MSVARLAVAAMFALTCAGTAKADLVVNNFTGFGTVENCSYGTSIEGDYAAVVDDEGPSPLYYYHFPTKTLTDVGLSGDTWVVGASLSNMKIAYIYRGSSWNENNIAIFNILTGETIDTGITTALRWDSYRPMRFFDGDRVMFVDSTDGHIKYYSISVGTVTDTGLIGWDPMIDGDIVAFTGRNSAGQYEVTIHNISTGETKVLEIGFGAVVAGDVVAFIATAGGSWSGEVKYYRLDSGATYTTGFFDIQVMSTDGRRIAIAPPTGSIKIYDIASGEVEDTGSWPCSGGSPCWVEIEGRYVAHERYESDIYASTPEGKVLIYPEEDLNGDSVTGSDCAGGWFISEVDNSPVAVIERLIGDIAPLDLPESAATSLGASLDVALRVLQDANERNDPAAVNVLQAALNEVEAQRGIQIDSEDADLLVAEIQNILTLLQ